MNAWATATTTSHPAFAPYCYMQDGTAYATDATRLPTYLYYVTKPPHSNVDDFNPFLNSFYYPGSTDNPVTGQARVNWWLGGSSPQTFVNAFAMGFTTGKSELMPLPQTQRDVNPNLSPQNYGY